MSYPMMSGEGQLFCNGYRRKSKSGSAAIRIPAATYSLLKDPLAQEETRKPIIR
jgi:hypothetical protein